MLKLLLRTDDLFSTLFLRLALGSVFFAHGAQKVLGLYGGTGYQKTIEMFTTQMSFPLWVPLVVMATEFLGSIFLILGFFTRIAALAIGISMGICAYLYHLQNGFFMNWSGMQKGEGFEFHILVIGIALTLLFKGGGLMSLDRLFVSNKR
ncbi:MAG: DoxX family protein [Nitrospiraceae bacterium]|nr:DoxX family protein [Nitrospiraceae bacterium]